MKRLACLLALFVAQVAYAQPSPTPSYTTIQSNGTPQVQRRIANFSGALSASDDSLNLKTNVIISNSGVTNAMLANPSATLNTTSPIGGGGTLTLGGSLTLTCTTCLTGTATTTGDMFYSTSGGNAMTRLPVGTSTQVLLGGSVPTWGTIPGGALPNVGPGAGSYTFATNDSVSLDAQGRVTGITNVTRTLTGGTGINTIGTLAADRTISIDQTFSPTWSGTHTFTLAPFIGDATGTTKTLNFRNAAATGALSWNPTGGRTLTLPDATDTLVGRATTDTLTNKTISGSSNTLTNIANGSLVNSSVTINTTSPVGGGGSVSLGGSLTLTCTSCLTGTPTAIGDIMYSTSGGQAMSPLADVAVGSYLRSGGAAAAPLWSTLKLPNAATTGDLLTATTTNTIGSIAAVAVNQVLLSQGTGTVPAWGTVPNAALTNSSVTINTTSPVGGGGSLALGGTLTLTCSTCVTGTLNSGRIPVASGAQALVDSNFTASSNALDLNVAGTMTVAGTTATALTLGGSNLTSGMTIGLGTSQNLNFQWGGTTGIAFQSNGALIQYARGGTRTFNIATETVDTAGDTLAVTAGNGGNASVTGGGNGGQLNALGGQGGTATTSLAAGAGGQATAGGGVGGTGAASGNGPGAGGLAIWRGGTGGAVTSGFGGGNGGNAAIRGGLATGTGTNGNVLIGDANTNLVNISGMAGALTLTAGATSTWDSKDGIIRAATFDTTTGVAMTIGGTNALNVSIARSGQNVLFPGGNLRAATPGTGVAAVPMLFGLANGAAASGATPATAGGTTTAQGGQGGAASTTGGGTAAAGGLTTVVGGKGGDGAASTNGPGNGGGVNITGGAGGTQNGVGTATGGNVVVAAGAGSGGGANGSISIGTTNTSSVSVGAGGITTNLNSNSIVYGDSTNTTKTVLGTQNSTANTVGGALVLAPSGGGNSNGSGAAGNGGALTARGAIGGNGSGGQNPGNGGDAGIAGGPAGTGGSGNANGGNLTLRGGAGQGTGTNGTVSVGDTNTSAVSVGASAITTTLQGNNVIADTKTLTTSLNGNTSSSAAWLSQQNTTAATNTQPQWAPGQESVGHGWTYVPASQVNAGQMSRSGSTVTVNTVAAHGLTNGQSIFLYPGEANFSTGVKGPITVTGSTSFTYSEAGSAVSSASGENVLDETGVDQTTKAVQVLRINNGKKFSVIGTDNGMSSPELVYMRSGYPNNGAYKEWFKLSALDPQAAYGGYNGPGVTFQTPQSDGVTPGTFLKLAPGTLSLITDSSIGFYVANSPGTPGTGGIISSFGTHIFSQGSYGAGSLMGAGYGAPGAPWYDAFFVRGDFSNVALGDIATPRWNDSAISPSVASWFSSSLGLNNGPYGYYSLGGNARFAAVAAPTSVTVTPTGGAAGSYTYVVVAVDRNGYTTLSTTGSTSTGPTTLGASNFNTVSWPAVPGAAYYDIYATSVSQANWLAQTTSTSFKHTGVAKYGTTNMAAPSMVTANWSAQGGGSGTSTTYAVYAVDADGRVIASSTASASFGAGPSLTNYWIIDWTPVGGAAQYIVTRTDLSHPIVVMAQQGVEQAAGTGKTFAKSGTSTVTVTDANGHGLKVGDTFNITSSGNTTNFPNTSNVTVASVTDATHFTYTDGVGTSCTCSTTANYAGPFITTSSFTDYGYPTRLIGSAARNTTADVTFEGQTNFKNSSATNNAATLKAQDSTGNVRFGVDSMGFPSYGARLEWRENWLMNQTINASGTNVQFTGGSWQYNTTANTGVGFTNTSGFATGSPLGSGLTINAGTANGNSTRVNSVPSIVQTREITNLYHVMEFPIVMSVTGANGFTALAGATNATISNTHPGGWYFSKTNADTNWQCKTDDGTTTNTIDSGVAASTSVQLMRMEYYGSGTPLGTRTVKFYINGSLVCTSTSNVYNGQSPLTGGTVNAQFFVGATATITNTGIGVGPVLMTHNIFSSTTVQ